jgi:outer membrane lipoprotein-sorting protein
VVARLSLSGGVNEGRAMKGVIARVGALRILIAFLIFPGALAGLSNSDDLSSNALLMRVWDGVQQAQKKYTSYCGTIVETRTSSLMAKPLVLRGKFCAEGTTRFELEYTEPAKVRIRYNQNYLNVTTGDKTEVLEVGGSVRRAQSYFSRDSSIGNLKKNFTISVQEDSQDFQMKLVPRTDAFRRRLNYLIVKLDKRSFLLRSLEVDGKSGVNSVFVIAVSSLNPKIPADTFEVYKPN